jgi:hypothetical protein
MVLGLLSLRSNRTAQAWWIWLPLGCLIGLNHAAWPMLGLVPSEALDLVGLPLDAFAFGLASVWLLAEPLQQRLRFLVFLKMLAALAGISAVLLVIRLDWETPFEAILSLVLLGLGSLVATIGFTLAGWFTRGGYRPAGLALWLAVLVAAGWLVISTPFFLLNLAAGAEAAWLDLLQVILVFTGITWSAMLPFLLLAFAHPFYRKRLKALLHLERNEPPPMVTASIPNVWESQRPPEPT